MDTGVLPSLPPYSPDVTEWSWTFNIPTWNHGVDRETFTLFWKLYHIHVNKVAMKLYYWPTAYFRRGIWYITYRPTLLAIVFYSHPSLNMANKRSNINLFIVQTTCFGRHPRPSSGDTSLWKVNWERIFFHSRTMHLDIIKVLLPTDAQENCFKWVLKFTLTFWHRSFTFKF
jgi:hypothetical protein